MKKIILLISFGLMYFSLSHLADFQVPHAQRGILNEIGGEDNPNARAEYEFLVMRDPVADAIPEGIRQREIRLSYSLPTMQSEALEKGQAYPKLNWKELGPDNVGGRTRAFAADIEHPGHLIAGGVDGGLWKSTNDGASWRLKLRPEQTHSTTCIVQDSRPQKTRIWYAGTGEIRGSTTNNTRWGSFYHGDGIYKSTDDGETWEILPSTRSGTPNTADAFDFNWNVVVNPANNVFDEVLAATWKGIYRSTNGGETWALAKASDAGTINSTSVTTDVAVTSEGVFYAHTRESGALKIWRSTNGVDWTSIAPAGFPTSSGRVVFGTAPSDPAVLYIFVQGPNGNSSGHAFWKYTYNGFGGLWEDRSAYLPSDLNTQSGYDQTVHVKPNDPNFVLIGGTNLYRSTDGFASSNTTATIGGYPYYPDMGHHPDIQGGMFSPFNANVYYSSNDGGIQRADNISMNGTMVWVSLNNGYNVTQVYSVAISPDAGDRKVIAGAQDNGSIGTDSSGQWDMIYGGDGTVMELPPVADDRMYTQYQNGPMQRQTRSGQNLASIQPSTGTRQLFVNPIVLDPNKSSILYYGGGSTSPTVYSGVWRNDNIQNATGTLGWTMINGSDVGNVTAWTRRVSAIGVSKSNRANVVYYGTTDGLIRRIDSASSTSPVCTDITPAGLNGGTATGGFVRCLAVDPLNSARAVAAFGNYNFRSLWLTTNGGASWIDVEGNLSGPDGPSVRWVTLVYNGPDLNVYAGTSIGLLMTEKLQGDSTVWVHAAASEIGNVLIAYMDYRESDRTLAVGTHGRGVFAAKLPGQPGAAETGGPRPLDFALEQNYPNPFNPSTSIQYTIAEAADVQLKIFSSSGREVAEIFNGYRNAGTYKVSFDMNRFNCASGVYYYRLSSGKYSKSMKMIYLK